MKSFRIAGLFPIIFILCLSLQGCLVAGIGAGVGAWKYGNAKKTEAAAKNRDSYNQYVLGMHNINFQRQKAGMLPEHVMTYNQYLNTN